MHVPTNGRATAKVQQHAQTGWHLAHLTERMNRSPVKHREALANRNEACLQPDRAPQLTAPRRSATGGPGLPAPYRIFNLSGVLSGS